MPDEDMSLPSVFFIDVIESYSSEKVCLLCVFDRKHNMRF